jgi:hypothetical protein
VRGSLHAPNSPRVPLTRRFAPTSPRKRGEVKWVRGIDCASFVKQPTAMTGWHLFVSRARCGVQRRFAEPGPICAAKGMDPGSAAHHFAPLIPRCARTRGRASAFPRHDFAPELCQTSRPKIEGAGNAGCTVAPIASRAKKYKHTSIVTTGTPAQPGIPRANGFTAYSALSLVSRALLPPSSARCASVIADLISASGYQDHTASPSACSIARLLDAAAATASRTQRS